MLDLACEMVVAMFTMKLTLYEDRHYTLYKKCNANLLNKMKHPVEPVLL